jgi:hydrogenase maturation protease
MTIPSVLVLGVGNTLRQDEGLGVRALERLLERYRLPEEIRAIDGRTLGLDLLPYLEDVSSLLIIDAVQCDLAHSELIRLEGPEIPSTLALKLCAHQVGLQELIATNALQGAVPDRMVLWGIRPRSIEWGLDLSPPVSAQIDALIDAVVGELAGWGLKCPSRSTTDFAHSNTSLGY